MTRSENHEGEEGLKTIIIGAGMSGVLAGIRLKERGRTNFVIYEKGDRIGGTWRENNYPGLTCDVPAHAYTYSFAPYADWSKFFADGAEIQQYFEKVVDDHGIRENIQLGKEIVECRYDDGHWKIRTACGFSDEADVVIAATGVLHHPKIPDIPGSDKFNGSIFHSTSWDHSVDLEDKRIGIIGNGSTGVQIVSALSTRAKSVVHFVRSPQWIMPIEQFAFSDQDKANFRDHPEAIEAIRNSDEYWSSIRRFNKAITDPESDAMKEIETLVAENLENSIKDPELKANLTPDYRAACKRLIYSWDYYNAVQRPGVVVEREGIENIEKTGIRLRNGKFCELDVIAFATGFKADRFVRPMKVFGRKDRDLDQVWGDQPSAYYAISVPEFPNFFFLNGPTAPVGNFSLIDIAEQQWAYIEHLLTPLFSGLAEEISASRNAMQDYDARRTEAAKRTIFGTGCSSWYLDGDGVPLTWPWTYDDFEREMKQPRLEDFDIR